MRLEHDARALRRASDPKEFGRVAVLLGGDSTERDISLLSGNAVLASLERRGVDAHAFDPRERALPTLLTEHFDRVWIALVIQILKQPLRLLVNASLCPLGDQAGCWSLAELPVNLLVLLPSGFIV